MLSVNQVITITMAMANSQAFVLWGLLLTKPKQISHIFIKGRDGK